MTSVMKRKRKPPAAVEAELIPYAALVGSDDVSVGSKIKKFLKRNRVRNALLYDLPESQRDIDFVVCPVLGIRTLNIKKMYVEGVLGMTMDEFAERFPEQPLSCWGHRKKISEGLSVEIAPGLTRHAASVIKSNAVRAAIGEDGLSINQRKGQRTRETLMRRDENGLSGYQKIAAVARPKQCEKRASMGDASTSAERSVWLAYRNFVIWLTNPLKIEVLGGRPSGRAGTQGAYHVDHKYTLIHGFKNKVSPWVIAHRANLCCLEWFENVSKSSKSTCDLEQLLSITCYTVEQSNAEYELFISAWQEKPTSSSVVLLERYNGKASTELQKKYPI